MKDFAIYGAGGFGREVYCLLKSINTNRQWNFIGFFDDVKEVGSFNEYGKIIGNIQSLNNWSTPLDIVIGIGNPKTVKAIIEKINNSFIDFPNIIASTCIFLDKESVSIGKGNIICNGCLFSCNISVGSFNVFNGFVTIGHDVTINNYNSIMPAVRISGQVQIGDENFFGVSSVILQRIKIGFNVVLGANSVLLKNPKDGITYMGNPAKKVLY